MGGDRMNRVILIGRLTHEVELRYTTSGNAVATFTLAVDRPRSKQKETDFIPIVVWQKKAENCANYTNKGSLVAVDGRLQVRTYDAKDGTKRWVTEVIAENVRFLDKKDKPGLEQIGEEVPFNEDDIPF
jgi:single-strand DNA-binding protein